MTEQQRKKASGEQPCDLYLVKFVGYSFLHCKWLPFQSFKTDMRTINCLRRFLMRSNSPIYQPAKNRVRIRKLATASPVPADSTGNPELSLFLYISLSIVFMIPFYR